MATHDYSLANQSGASFRLDLNNALAAIVSNNSNSSSPATTYAYQWWADTSNALLKIRNSANNAWITLFTLAGGLDVSSTSTFRNDVTFNSVNTISFDQSASEMNFNDDAKLVFGTGSDLEIFHDSSDSFIKEVGTGNLKIIANQIQMLNATNSENLAKFIQDGAVELYHNNAKKIETLSTGAQVTGRFHVGTSSALINETSMSLVSGGNTAVIKAEGAAGHNPLICWNNATSGDRSQIQFGDGTSFSSHGTITTNGANVTYGGQSDYRLKQDDVLITDGIEKIKQLLPKRFKWKNNLDLGICDGFFAHEVQETMPTAHAVVGTKDAVDSDGNAIYQQIDHAKLIPILTAALKESIAKIETLETKVAALEAA